MSKQTKVEVEQEEVIEVIVPEVKLTRYMIGTYIDAVSGEWMLSYVKFDPITQTLGEVKTERVSGDEEVLRERLVIRQGQLGLLEPGEASDSVTTNIY